MILRNPRRRRVSAGRSLVSVAAVSAGVWLVVASAPVVFAQNAPPQPGMVPPPGMGKPAPKKPLVKLPPTVVARVGGKNIMSTEALAAVDTFGKFQIVRQLVQNAVLDQEAKRLKVSVTKAEIDKAVQEAKNNLVQQQMMQRGQPMTIDEISARDGITDDLIRYSVRLQALARKCYAKTIEKTVPTLDTQVKVSHILIPTVLLAPAPDAKEPTPAENEKRDADARTKIAGILADIKANKITFEDAAKKYSEDKGSAAQGGALPFYGRGQLDPAFEKAAFDLATPGQITGPIKSQFGYHLIKLIQQGKNAPQAEKAAFVKQQVNAQLANPQGVQAWLQQKIEQSDITINPNARITPKPVRTSSSR